MRNRKDKPIGMRLLSTVATFLLIGSVIYIFVAGITFHSGAVLAAAVLGLGVPAVSAGEGILDIVAEFFESFLDGLMEVIGGIIDAISSIFG